MWKTIMHHYLMLHTRIHLSTYLAFLYFIFVVGRHLISRGPPLSASIGGVPFASDVEMSLLIIFYGDFREVWAVGRGENRTEGWVTSPSSCTRIPPAPKHA